MKHRTIPRPNPELDALLSHGLEESFTIRNAANWSPQKRLRMAKLFLRWADQLFDNVQRVELAVLKMPAMAKELERN